MSPERFGNQGVAAHVEQQTSSIGMSSVCAASHTGVAPSSINRLRPTLVMSGVLVAGLLDSRLSPAVSSRT